MAIEECLTISLPDLRKRGYFSRRRTGLIEWYYGGDLRAGVMIRVSFDEERPHKGGTLVIAYERHRQYIEQIVQLAHVPSNLGRGGGIWYFICPVTGLRCRVLIATAQRGFVSRHAGLRYQSQRCSHKQRTWIETMNKLRRKEKVIESVQWLTSPHSKRSYGGKLTRPMLRFNRLINLDEMAKNQYFSM